MVRNAWHISGGEGALTSSKPNPMADSADKKYVNSEAYSDKDGWGVGGRTCNPCPICICPCWCRHTCDIMGADDGDQCDFWLFPIFCGNFCEFSLCTYFNNENMPGYPNVLQRGSTCYPTIISKVTDVEWKNQDFAAHHFSCCHDETENNSEQTNQCFCQPYTTTIYANGRRTRGKEICQLFKMCEYKLNDSNNNNTPSSSTSSDTPPTQGMSRSS